jgi:hypothetical protein
MMGGTPDFIISHSLLFFFFYISYIILFYSLYKFLFYICHDCQGQQRSTQLRHCLTQQLAVSTLARDTSVSPRVLRLRGTLRHPRETSARPPRDLCELNGVAETGAMRQLPAESPQLADGKGSAVQAQVLRARKAWRGRSI